MEAIFFWLRSRYVAHYGDFSTSHQVKFTNLGSQGALGMLWKPQVRSRGRGLNWWCSFPVQSNSLTQDMDGNAEDKCIHFPLCITNYHKPSGSEQHIFTIPQLSWVLSWVLYNQGVGRDNCLLWDSGNFFQAHSGYWQNSGPCDWRTEALNS